MNLPYDTWDMYHQEMSVRRAKRAQLATDIMKLRRNLSTFNRIGRNRLIQELYQQQLERARVWLPIRVAGQRRLARLQEDRYQGAVYNLERSYSLPCGEQDMFDMKCDAILDDLHKQYQILSHMLHDEALAEIARSEE